MQFTARAVGIVESEEDNHLTVVLADDEEVPEHVLQLSIALRFDEQDRALGMATYSITVDAAATTYGGVERYELTDEALALRLSVAASLALGTGREVAVDLDLGAVQHAELGAAVSRVLSSGRSDPPDLAVGDP